MQVKDELLGSGALMEQPEWRNVPSVVRNTFLLMAQEIKRLQQLVTTDQLQYSQGHKIVDLEVQIRQLKAEIEDLKCQTHNAELRTKRAISSVWGEVAATAQTVAHAQTQQAAADNRSQASWSHELQILRIKVNEHDRKLSTNRIQIDLALHELQKSQELCRQELKGLQRLVQVSAVVDVPKQDEEVRSPEHLEVTQKLKIKKKEGHVLPENCLEDVT